MTIGPLTPRGNPPDFGGDLEVEFSRYFERGDSDEIVAMSVFSKNQLDFGIRLEIHTTLRKQHFLECVGLSKVTVDGDDPQQRFNDKHHRQHSRVSAILYQRSEFQFRFSFSKLLTVTAAMMMVPTRISLM